MNFLFYSFCFHCPKTVIHPQGPIKYYYSWYEIHFKFNMRDDYND